MKKDRGLMDKISIHEAKDRLAKLIEVATNEGKQFCITSDAGNVVVLPEETYENILVTLELLSTPGLMDNLKFNDDYESEALIEQMPHASNH